MTMIGIKIPAGMAFADLDLRRDSSTGDVTFEWGVIERICAESGIDVAVFRDNPEDNIAGLMAAWYAQARAAGEPIDIVQEELIAEVRMEDQHGGGLSHKPGRA